MYPSEIRKTQDGAPLTPSHVAANRIYQAAMVAAVVLLVISAV
jgi:hypothetical protein